MMVRGKAYIISRLEGLTQKNVTIGFFKVSAPLNLQIKNLNIEGLAKIENISMQPSIPNLMIGRIALNNVNITKPEFTFERKATAAQEAAAAETAPVSIKPRKKLPRRMIFKRVIIKDGKIFFTDHTVGPEGIRITVKDINLNLTNLFSFPYTTITNFDLTGRIPWQQGTEDGKISLEGWMNFAKKDMQAVLKIESIDGVYLYPYYSNWVDLEKARIDKAKLNFTSNISGLNNNVTAECHLELTDIVHKPVAPGGSEEKAAKITEEVLDIFRALNEGKIVLDFTIRTKMDRPQFGFGNIKMALEDKLAKVRNNGRFGVQDVLMLPGRLLTGTVRGATDFSKAIIDGTFAVGNELKKAVQDTFKREPKTKQD